MYFKFTNRISQDEKQVAVWSVTVFSYFFLSQLEKSLIRDGFFPSSGCSNLSLLPICTGGRSHRLAWSLHIRGTSSAFVKKKRIGLCFTDGNMWPSKISNGPKKNRKGPNMALKITDLGTTPSLHGRMYYLPKLEAYLKRWDPQFQ